MFKSILNYFRSSDPTDRWYNLNDANDPLRPNFGSQATIDSVLGLPAYWKGINNISYRVGNLNLELWREKDNDIKTIEKKHPSRKLGCRMFDDHLSSKEGIRIITANALRFGNGFGLIHRVNGEPNKITVINPSRVTVYQTYYDDGRIEPSYTVEINGKLKPVSSTEMVHIRGLSSEGIVGFSVIEKLNTALSLNLQIYRYSETYFQNNATPKIVISYPLGSPVVKDAQIQDLEKKLDDRHRGTNRSHRPAIINNGGVVKELSDNALEAQLLESKQFSLVDVANILGCPVSKLNGQQTTSYASLEADSKAYLEDCLNVWLCQIENEFSIKLLTEAEKDEGELKFIFDRTELERPDAKTHSDILMSQFSGGAINHDELRIGLGYSPSNTTDGFFVNGTQKTLESAINPPEPPAAQPAATEPPVDPDAKDEASVAPAEPPEPSRSIVNASVDRLMTRIQKSAHQIKDGDWYAAHQAVFRSSLPGCESIVDAFFVDLEAELTSVAKADHDKIINYRVKNNVILDHFSRNQA